MTETLTQTIDEISLSNREIERYSRHLIMPEVGMEGQKRLKSAKVLLVGTGGLGSPIAMYLAAAGVGTIGLVDFDTVDYSNLQRQIIHSTTAVGKSIQAKPKVLEPPENQRQRQRDFEKMPSSYFRLSAFSAAGVGRGDCQIG